AEAKRAIQDQTGGNLRGGARRFSALTSVALRAPSVSAEGKAKPDRSCAIKTGHFNVLPTHEIKLLSSREGRFHTTRRSRTVSGAKLAAGWIGGRTWGQWSWHMARPAFVSPPQKSAHTGRSGPPSLDPAPPDEPSRRPRGRSETRFDPAVHTFCS